MPPWRLRTAVPTARSTPGDPGASLELERLVDRALRDLPLEPAPDTLQARVLGRIALAAPNSLTPGRYAQWPRAARALFVIGSGLCAALGSIVVPGLASDVLRTAADAHGIAPFSDAGASAVALAELIRGLCAALPREWIYGGLLAASALYATLVALAAMSYRALTGAAPREIHRS